MYMYMLLLDYCYMFTVKQRYIHHAFDHCDCNYDSWFIRYCYSLMHPSSVVDVGWWTCFVKRWRTEVLLIYDCFRVGMFHTCISNLRHIGA